HRLRPATIEFMQWARPKSLSGLMLLGLALIGVPLLIAVVDAALQIRALADAGQRLGVEGVDAARGSQNLYAQSGLLERRARRDAVLIEPKLLDLFREQDELLSATRQQLYAQLRDGEARATLDRLGELQGTIRLSVLSMRQGAADPADLWRRFEDLVALADRVSQDINEQIDAEVAALEARTQSARRRLAWEAALLVPLTILTIIGLKIGRASCSERREI